MNYIFYIRPYCNETWLILLILFLSWLQWQHFGNKIIDWARQVTCFCALYVAFYFIIPLFSYRFAFNISSPVYRRNLSLHFTTLNLIQKIDTKSDKMMCNTGCRADLTPHKTTVGQTLHQHLTSNILISLLNLASGLAAVLPNCYLLHRDWSTAITVDPGPLFTQKSPSYRYNNTDYQHKIVWRPPEV